MSNRDGERSKKILQNDLKHLGKTPIIGDSKYYYNTCNNNISIIIRNESSEILQIDFKYFGDFMDFSNLLSYLSQEIVAKILYFLKVHGYAHLYELHKVFGVPFSRINYHLMLLKEKGIIQEASKTELKEVISLKNRLRVRGPKSAVLYKLSDDSPVPRKLLAMLLENILPDEEKSRIKSYERFRYTSYHKFERAFEALSNIERKFGLESDEFYKAVELWSSEFNAVPRELKSEYLRWKAEEVSK